jgi:hypothetical protein
MRFADVTPIPGTLNKSLYEALFISMGKK